MSQLSNLLESDESELDLNKSQEDKIRCGVYQEDAI